jgi:hypothetical protein
VENVKRGQITVFIILIIVILLCSIILLTITQKELAMSTQINQISFENIKEEIIDCNSQKVDNIIRRIFYNGGYYEPPKEITLIEPSFFPPYSTIYILNNNIYIPTVEDIQYEIMNRIKTELEQDPLCINTNYTYIESSNIIYTQEPTYSDSTFSIRYDTKMHYNEKEYSFTDMIILSTEEIKQFIEAATSISKQKIANGDYICIPCVKNIAEKNNLSITYQEAINGSAVIYTMENKYYKFHFSHILNPIKENELFYIAQIDNQEIKIGDKLTIPIIFRGEGIRFITDSEKFIVNNNTITGIGTEIGSEPIILTAIDRVGNIKTTSFLIKVIEE